MRSSFALFVLVPVLAVAQAEPSPGSLLQAVSHAPTLTAARQRIQAAQARVEASGRWADPEVEGMGSRRVGPMNERSTMWELNVRQPLPKRGERAADRERAGAVVAMAEAEFAVMAGEMAAETAMALAEAEGALARVRLMETQRGRLDAVQRSVDSRLASGGGRLTDRLAVQTRLASLQLAIEDEQRMRADALAEAAGRLGLPPDGVLPAFAAPAAAEIDPDTAASVRLAAARAAEAAAMVKMARSSARPMTAVGLRLELERAGMGDEDTLGVAFMSEIPWRGRRYARAEERAAEAERMAAQTDAEAVRHRIRTAVTRAERAERLAATARRLSLETLERFNAEYETLVRSAGVSGAGESTVFLVVELLEKATETELQVIQADTAARTARAELWRYASPEPFFHVQP